MFLYLFQHKFLPSQLIYATKSNRIPHRLKTQQVSPVSNQTQFQQTKVKNNKKDISKTYQIPNPVVYWDLAELIT